MIHHLVQEFTFPLRDSLVVAANPTVLLAIELSDSGQF